MALPLLVKASDGCGLEGGALTRSAGNLIVVDDEALMRNLLRDFLSSQGFRVSCFSTANAALKAVRANSESVGVVLADIRMVPVSGMELLLSVRRDFPQLPVVLFTSAGTPEQREQALMNGAFHYLTKPFSLTDLKKILESALITRQTKTD